MKKIFKSRGVAISWPVPPRPFSSAFARRRAVLALKKRMNAGIRRASQVAIQASLERSLLEPQQLTKIASVLRILEQRSTVRPAELIPRGLSNIIFPDAPMVDRDPGAF